MAKLQLPDCLMHFLSLIAVCWPGIYTSAPESSTLATRLPSHPVVGGWGLNIKLLFEIPKRHILARNLVSDVHLFCVDVEAGRPLGCRFFENRPPPQIKNSQVNFGSGGARNYAWAETKPHIRSGQNQTGCMVSISGIVVHNRLCKFCWRSDWALRGVAEQTFSFPSIRRRAELVRVRKSWQLVEMCLTTLFQSSWAHFKNTLA